MRAAVFTTALVIVALALYANQRADKRAREVASASAGAALPDVAAPPPDVAPAQRAVPVTPEPVYAPATEPETRSHVVAPGDSLESLAARYYGNSQRAAAIYEANRDQIRDPGHLHEGQTLIIP